MIDQLCEHWPRRCAARTLVVAVLDNRYCCSHRTADVVVRGNQHRQGQLRRERHLRRIVGARTATPPSGRKTTGRRTVASRSPLRYVPPAVVDLALNAAPGLPAGWLRPG